LGPNNPFAIFALPVEVGELVASAAKDDTGWERISGNGPKTIEDARGHVLIVEVFTLDCHACDERLTAYRKLYVDTKGLRVIAVEVDPITEQTKADLERRADALDLDYSVMIDQKGGLRSKLDEKDLPVCMVFDRDGKLALSKLTCNGDGLDAVVSTARRLLATE